MSYSVFEVIACLIGLALGFYLFAKGLSDHDGQ
jgi:hypothetical protein